MSTLIEQIKNTPPYHDILKNTNLDLSKIVFNNSTIWEKSKYILTVDPNGGTYAGKSSVQRFGPEVVLATNYSKQFDYTGSYQTWEAPYSGFYYIEAVGAQGGGDGSAMAAGGGYVKAYKYFNKGDKLYISVGGRGKYWGNKVPGGWNGGAASGYVGNDTYLGVEDTFNSDPEHGIYNALTGCVSGSGGGATSIQTTLRGDGQLKSYASYKDEVLVVAGGSTGAIMADAGAGGEVLYVYTSTNKTWPGMLVKGDPSSIYLSNFAEGQYVDGDVGGGGGGWVGGKAGIFDNSGANNHSKSGGGASFVNTSKGCIVLDLISNYNKKSFYGNHGWVKLSYVSGFIALEVPVRSGYTFVGWQFTNVASSKTDEYGFGTTMVQLNQGKSVAKALWTR